jgi:hypothetical protein
MTAATACRTCGTEPREGARFCDGCGAPVTANDTHAEYKQVTVLFADLVPQLGWIFCTYCAGGCHSQRAVETA